MATNEQWHLATDAAVRYERVVARHILAPWAASLVAAADLRPGERAIDLACGTGVVARSAAQRLGRSGAITGVDLNPGMIAVARSLPPIDGAAIEWLVASALALPLPDAHFDVVLCQQGAQFFPDRFVAFREMRRVLRPGGRIALSVWRSAGVYNAAVGDALRRHFGEETAARFCASRDVPPADALAGEAAEAGFANVELRVQTERVRLPDPAGFVLAHLAATPIAAAVGEAGERRRSAFGADVAHALRAYRDAGGIVYSEEVNVVTGSI